MFQIDSLASPWPIVRATADFAETLPPAGAHGHASAGVDVAAAAPRRGSAVQLQGIELRYPGSDVPALHGIDLDIAAGEVFGIIGRSGAGKSSLVRTINLLNRPSAGRCATACSRCPKRPRRMSSPTPCWTLRMRSASCCDAHWTLSTMP